MALLAATWAVPRNARADAYALQEVKNIVDALKPNVLIVLDSAASMQGLPGENPSRYNEVGADCEEGSRYCRLVNQDGRYAFSGMGANGMYFGGVPPSCTHTQTDTSVGNSSTVTYGSTATFTQTTVAFTASGSGTQTGTGSGTASKVVTGTGTTTVSGTGTGTGQNTMAVTVTGTASANANGTVFAYATGSSTGAVINGVTATDTQQMITTQTGIVTLTDTVTAFRTATLTGTVTTTAVATVTATAANATATASKTYTNTVSVTCGVTGTGTITASGSAIGSGTVTGNLVITVTGVGTQVSVGTGTGSAVLSKTATSTSQVVGAPGTVVTVTDPVVQTITASIVQVTITKIGTGIGTVTKTGSQTVTATGTALATGGGTAYNTGSIYITSSASGTTSGTTTATWPGTATAAFTWTFGGTGVSPSLNTNQTSGTAVYGPPAQQASWPSGTRFTATGRSVGTSTQTVTATGTASQNINNITWTATFTGTSNSRAPTINVTGIWTDTQNQVFGGGVISGTRYTTGTVAGSTSTTTNTTTRTTTQTTTLGTTHANTGTATGIVMGTTNVTIGGAMVTGSATVTASGVATGTGSWAGNDTATASANLTMVGSGTQTASGSLPPTTMTSNITGTILATGTATLATTTNTTTNTLLTSSGTATATYVQNVTNTITSCTLSGGSDLGRCDSPPQSPTSSGGICYETAVSCTLDTGCSGIRDDFCRIIKASDGYGRVAPEDCITSPAGGTNWGRCKRGRATANAKCGPYTDASCNSASDQDFCAEGQPAQMCQDSGMWCRDSSDCPSGDACGPASSRMMTVKRALRRAITDNADKVSFGFMNFYQGPTTATNTSTAIYPYVKLQSCPATVDVTETKLFTRGELQRMGQFPFGGSGPVGFTFSGVTYSVASVTGNGFTGDNGTGDSRWVIPRGDGTGKFNHYTASWTTCPGTNKPDVRPACDFGSLGTGLYEGTYYTFTYKRGTPVATGAESMSQPNYQSTYMGKYWYVDSSHCYNLIDAERSDIVNDGIFNRPAYVLAGAATTPYTVTGTSTAIDTSKEVYVSPPLAGPANVTPCSAMSGAIWNSNAVPFLNKTGTVTATGTGTASDNALAITTRLDKASLGGVAAVGANATLGCALNNDGAAGEFFGAAGYMSKVQANDFTNNGNATPCWSNNIILVVDGHASGPTEIGTVSSQVVDCASTACASATPTWAGGCYCPAINKAYALAQSGVETHVVFNAPTSWATFSASYSYPYYTYAFMLNLALAGSRNNKFNNANSGTPGFGTSEEEVYEAISDKIAAAAHPFVYTTAAPVAGATTMDPTTRLLTPSQLVYDTSVNYPAWQGDVRAFDTTPALKWDAVGTANAGHPGGVCDGSPAVGTSWKYRRIYFSDKNGAVFKVVINPDGTIPTASTLNTAGLGAAGNTAEAERIMQWLLGKPGLGNPAPLMGPITASTPIVVGQATMNGQSGSEAYSTATWKRPQILYVGADDGMLHAFFAPAAISTDRSFPIGSCTFYAGEEAFAFIPMDMLPVITKLYAQGGQNLSADQKIDPNGKVHQNTLADKGQHVFGLAGSPKVKDMCWGTGCSGSDGTGWHTVLVMTEGPGGNKPFALDITNVVTASAFNGLTVGATGTGSLLWSAAVVDPSLSYKWDKALGETTSVPAFYMNGASNHVLFASGYPTVNRTTSGYSNQGLVLADVTVNASTGVWDDGGTAHTMGTVGAVSCASGTWQQQRAVLADIALARNWSGDSTSQNLVGAYVVDTWGNTFQYVPGMGALTPAVYNLGCGQPLYFSPAVVQLDKLQTGVVSALRQIYLVQVTNSNLDPDTRAYSATADSTHYPGSQLVVSKLNWDGVPGNQPTLDTNYGSNGHIILATDASSAQNRICLKPAVFTKTIADSCGGTGLPYELPKSARPVGTPTVIMRSDALGFQVITSWYDWTQSSNNCTLNPNFDYGASYVTVHEFGADGNWYQIAGFTLANTVLTGATFVGTGFFLDGIMGVGSGGPQAQSFGESIVSLQQILNNSALERYSRTNWSERLE